MDIIIEWGNAFRNMTSEAIKLKQEYLKNKDNMSTAERKEFLRQIWDITDTRKFCVVTTKKDGIAYVRHIIRVTDNAELKLNELKAEYYKDYSKYPTDEFHFFIGLHKANEYQESIRSENQI